MPPTTVVCDRRGWRRRRQDFLLSLRADLSGKVASVSTHGLADLLGEPFCRTPMHDGRSAGALPKPVFKPRGPSIPVDQFLDETAS